MSLSHGKLCLRYSSVLFEKRGGGSFVKQNRTLEYLRHNFIWDRLISRQTDNPWSSYSQDLKPPDYFLRGTWKTVSVKTIHRQERTSEEKSDGFHKKMLNRVVENFNVRVAAVLSYSSAVYETNTTLITEKV